MERACRTAGRGGRRSDAGRASRLRPADRRRAGDRERGHPVRGRRGHRLPDEAVGPRPPGRGRSNGKAERLAQALETRDAFRRRRRVHETPREHDGAGRGLDGHAVTSAEQGQGLVAARHAAAAATTSSSSASSRSTEPDLGPGGGRVPGAALSHSGSRGTGAHGRATLQQARARPAPGAAAGAAPPGLARPRLARRARNTGRRWS